MKLISTLLLVFGLVFVNPVVGKSESTPILYVSETCSWCHKVEAELNKYQIRYKLRNVSKDRKAYDYLVSHSSERVVPQLYVSGQYLIGYNPIHKWILDHVR